MTHQQLEVAKEGDKLTLVVSPNGTMVQMWLNGIYLGDIQPYKTSGCVPCILLHSKHLSKPGHTQDGYYEIKKVE